MHVSLCLQSGSYEQRVTFKAFGPWFAMTLQALEGGQGSGKKTADSFLQPTSKVSGGAYRNVFITAATTILTFDRLLVKFMTEIAHAFQGTNTVIRTSCFRSVLGYLKSIGFGRLQARCVSKSPEKRDARTFFNCAEIGFDV